MLMTPSSLRIRSRPTRTSAEGPFHTWVATAGVVALRRRCRYSGQVEYGHGAPFGDCASRTTAPRRSAMSASRLDSRAGVELSRAPAFLGDQRQRLTHSVFIFLSPSPLRCLFFLLLSFLSFFYISISPFSFFLFLSFPCFLFYLLALYLFFLILPLLSLFLSLFPFLVLSPFLLYLTPFFFFFLLPLTFFFLFLLFLFSLSVPISPFSTLIALILSSFLSSCSYLFFLSFISPFSFFSSLQLLLQLFTILFLPLHLSPLPYCFLFSYLLTSTLGPRIALA